jgi:hypothetical protein
MVEFDVKAFVTKLDRMGLKLTAVPLAAGNHGSIAGGPWTLSNTASKFRIYGRPKLATASRASRRWPRISGSKRSDARFASIHGGILPSRRRNIRDSSAVRAMSVHDWNPLWIGVPKSSS